MSSEISFTGVNRSEAAAEKYYSRLSPIYDLLAASEKKFIKQGLDLLDPKEGERILEIGSGTGYAQLDLALKAGNGFCIGVDLSQGMCRIAQNKIIKAGFSDRAYILRGNTFPIPIKAESLDGIFSSFTLELFGTPQIPLVLGECRRVLKPAGRLVVVSLSKDKPLPWPGRLYERLHNRYPILLDCRPIPVKALVKEAGFNIISSREQKMWGLPVVLLSARG